MEGDSIQSDTLLMQRPHLNSLFLCPGASPALFEKNSVISHSSARSRKSDGETPDAPHRVNMKLAELSADEQEEANERQLAELEFVQSAYSTEEAWISKNDGCRSVVRLLQLPVVLSGNTHHDSVTIHLHLKLPAAYPIRNDAHLIISASLKSSPANPSLIRKAALNAITSLVTTCQSAACDYAQYGEAIWHVFHVAEEWIDNDWPNMLLQQQETQSMKSTYNTPASSSPTSSHNHTTIRIGRRAIYSHHIIANSKRKDLASLAHNYKLGGYVKIGWPGIILFEGDETSVQTVVDEVKTWRWQHLSVRVEESFDVNIGTIDSYRKLPKTFVELGENDMSLLAQYCREAGLEYMFLQCLKIDNGTTQSSTTLSTIHNDENDETKQASNNTNMTYAALVHVDHMNDRKNYEKWLKKESESVGCTLFIKHVVTTS
eukprot:scaffold211410_cov59-Cyclotella_meneghiniana.AAC.1